MMINIDLLLLWGSAFKKLVPNEIIFHENETGKFYYQLYEGSVRWVNVNENGNEFIHHLVEPGESFGEFSLFDDSPNYSTANANENSIVIRLHKTTFWKLLRDNPDILLNFIHLFVERLRFKSLLLNEISSFGPEHRITTLLSYFKQTQKMHVTIVTK